MEDHDSGQRLPAVPRARTAAHRIAGVTLLAALLLVVSGCSRAEEPPAPAANPLPTPYDLAPDAVTDPAFPSLTYGIQAFLWWNGTTRPYDLDAMRLMNFTHVKQIFAWADVEPVDDEWHWQQADAVVAEAQCRGRQIVARLDHAPEWAAAAPGDDPAAPPVNLDAWGEFCGTLAARYKGQIAAYQVWNEPNLDREWGGRSPNAEGYVSLLKTCSQAIHTADPDAIIISAGLAPTGTVSSAVTPDMIYLRQMYDAGASEWFDVLGLNAPGYNDPPSTSPEEAAEKYDGNRWRVFRHVEDMRAIMVDEGDAAKQVAILEMGWTTDSVHPDYAWHAVTEQQQADYLVGAYQWAAEHWRPWVGLMTTIYLSDFDWTPDDEEYWWAIDLPSFPPKTYRPAFIALANMEKVSGDTVIPARDPGSPEATTLQPLTCPN
ncbi:beta-galactosidase [Aggregatilinea lenta]|uniref:beta-galactosidase n=1 Tax=Aggregatilinea lenta TaxID=913108 RepID=UPI000E5B4CA9|nr:beta-galactosidase [Aggregatilinea lenta]